MNTTTKKKKTAPTDSRYPHNREGSLLRRCEDLARRGGLSFADEGKIRIKRRYYKGRFSSRLFRAAVEILTRRTSRLFSITEDRRGRPVEVLLYCPHCINRSAYWAPTDSRFSRERWREEHEIADQAGCCTGCWAPVELYRDRVTFAWRAAIGQPSERQSPDRY